MHKLALIATKNYILSGADTPSIVNTLRSVIRAAFTSTKRALVNTASSSFITRQLL
jgi:hypothetical protein